MPVLMIHETPGGTREQYEEGVARLTDGRGLSTLDAWPVDGILAHVAAATDDGWCVVDVWESEEAYERFGEVIGPVLQEVGMPGLPRLFPVHHFVSAATRP
ncbi:MAG: hypothetical protein M3331_09105 [Actinomycetota bacterium]|nr:hypothetical protein [Actinomycetota bacterium]